MSRNPVQQILLVTMMAVMPNLAFATNGHAECEAIRTKPVQYAWCLAGFRNLAKCSTMRAPDNEKMWCRAFAGRNDCAKAVDENDRLACDAIRRDNLTACRSIKEDDGLDAKWFCHAVVEEKLSYCSKLDAGRSSDDETKKTNCQEAIQGITFGRSYTAPEPDDQGFFAELGRDFRESLEWTGLFPDEDEAERNLSDAEDFWSDQEEELAASRSRANELWDTAREATVGIKRHHFGRAFSPDEMLPESGNGIGPALPPGVKQQSYSRVEYAEMWAKHQGHDMTARQAKTLRRGCIGITAVNLSGGGNPISSAEAIFSDFNAAKRYMDEANQLLSWLQDNRNPATKWLVPGGQYPQNWRYVMFGKLYWSNQDSAFRGVGGIESDADAFPSDDHGEMDLENFRARYDYKARPKTDDDGTVSGGYINFDYAFYDEARNEMWHANHMEYDDPEKQVKSPMKVLQSTPAKFAAGYTDFDRVLYGVALAKDYDVKQSAHFWIKK